MKNIKRIFENGPVYYIPVKDRVNARSRMTSISAVARSLGEKVKCNFGLFVDSKHMEISKVVRVELLTNGEGFKHRKGKRTKEPKKLKDMRAMRGMGISFQEIAKKFNMTRQAVQQYLRYHND